jgi:hypothetical protein
MIRASLGQVVTKVDPTENGRNRIELEAFRDLRNILGRALACISR